jgi:hypothetical protein
MSTEAGPIEVVYFRQIEDAQAFMAAFPELEMANKATSKDTLRLCP